MADLIFPHAGGRYANSPHGVPIVIGIQNADAAARFGFQLRWQLKEAPDRRGEVSVQVGGGAYPPLSPFDQATDVNATRPLPPWVTTAKTTGPLRPGNYTFTWGLGLVPYCDFGGNKTTYEYGHAAWRGSLPFTIVGDNEVAMPPPLSLISGNKVSSNRGGAALGGEKGKGKGNGTDSSGDANCPNLMGVVSYVSTAPWSRAAATQTHPADPRWHRVLEATTGVCAVTARATFTPGPCRATVDPAFETSVFNLMGWPLPTPSTVTTTTTTTPSRPAMKTSMRPTMTPTSTAKSTPTLAPTMTPMLTPTSTPTMTSMTTPAPERKGMNNHSTNMEDTATVPPVAGNVATGPGPAAPMDPAMLPPGFVSLGASLTGPSSQYLALAHAMFALLLFYI
ncbi:hypothetical protein PG991_001062 [Apiospora marii]|uniref:DUF7136 domain-containing protein n=1 Tax=Apiospora marii TaxID=335849 RepID=A0ABR1SV34_9PEZI